ncbi:MAG: carotenoid oxygenase [Actinobacteria bacterium]|nr:MAG: carotenoid oxygenase [Actinomycetota bacterium]
MTDIADRRTNENPYLAGNMAPVEEEITAFDLPVTGEIPAELEGRWLRNGPNPMGEVDAAKHHWFMGSGMVHGVRLRGGKAEWYRNRYVDPKDEIGPNTNVGGFAGTTWAMVEAGQPPVELDYELNPLGVNRFNDTLSGPFSAHPKYDAATGELHAVTYQWPDLIDHLQYVVVGTDGKVTKTLDIPVDDMPMVHDMSLTDKYAIVYDLPVTVNFDLIAQGFGFPFAWAPDRAARVGLVPRDGTANDIIWCDVNPCYVFHPLNAYDAPDGTVVIDLCRYETVMTTEFRGPLSDGPTFDRWVIDPVAKKVHETTLDDRPQEFPRHNPKFGLKRHQFGYTAEFGPEQSNIHAATLKVDVNNGITQAHSYGFGRGGAEPIFVPKDGASEEDAGWIFSLVYDATTDQSELCILDAQDFTGPEVARIHIPQRVPFGFHGNWVSDTSVPPN